MLLASPLPTTLLLSSNLLCQSNFSQFQTFGFSSSLFQSPPLDFGEEEEDCHRRSEERVPRSTRPDHPSLTFRRGEVIVGMEGRERWGILSFRGCAPAGSSHRDIFLNRVKIHYVSLSHEERPLCRHCCWVPFILLFPVRFPSVPLTGSLGFSSGDLFGWMPWWVVIHC